MKPAAKPLGSNIEDCFSKEFDTQDEDYVDVSARDKAARRSARRAARLLQQLFPPRTDDGAERQSMVWAKAALFGHTVVNTSGTGRGLWQSPKMAAMDDLEKFGWDSEGRYYEIEDHPAAEDSEPETAPPPLGLQNFPDPGRTEEATPPVSEGKTTMRPHMPAAQEEVAKRKRGRPATGSDPSVTVRLPAEWKKELEARAKRLGVPLSAVMVAAVEQYLGKEEQLPKTAKTVREVRNAVASALREVIPS